MKLLDLLNENVDLDVKAVDGKVLINNMYKYQLKVDKGGLLGWINVSVKNIIPTQNSFKITASALGFTQSDIVPVDSITIIKNNLGKDKIDLGGETPKRLVKIK